MHTILRTSDGIMVGQWAKSRDHGGDQFVSIFRCENLAAALYLVCGLNGGMENGIAATENGFAVTPYGDCEMV